jgi:predicted O-methyltransferase YrrM
MNLFTEIEQALAKIPDGWCSLEKAQTLAAAVIALRPKNVVEIGVYSGRSFIPMAMALKEIGSGMAFGIDPYSAQASAENEVGENKDWWGRLDHEKIYQNFMSKIAELKLEQFARIVRKKSDDISATPGLWIDLLHIDGSHTDQAVRDVQRFASHVRCGGLVFCDDISWVGDGVKKSIAKLIELGFEERYRVVKPEPSTGLQNDWAVFQRI